MKDSKTRVTFVTEQHTLNDIKELVMREKQQGRKMTVSKYIDEVLTRHVRDKSFWGADEWPE